MKAFGMTYNYTQQLAINIADIFLRSMKSIKEIEEYFNTHNFSNEPVSIKEAEVINDIELFVKTHIQYLKHNKGNKRFLPYYNRLLLLYNHCIIKEKV